jgi:hypothetical protein
VGNKLSHSSAGKYMACPEMYRLHYKEKVRALGIGSALLFGKAIDHAIEVMLSNGDYANAFLAKWDRQEINGQEEYLATHPEIVYFKSDLDEGLLSVDDRAELEEKRPSTINSLDDAKSVMNQAAFKRISHEVLSYYNFACWLSLRAKGLLMLDAYDRDIKPRIKKVLAIQKPIKLESKEGDEVIGFIDLIAELDTGEVAILDNKTSGRPYEEDKVKTSAQLALYSYAMSDEFPHTKCGYLVMIKKIQKEYKKTCTVCGAGNTSAHKTCNEKVDGKRCNGDFRLEPQFYAQTQFIIDEIPERTKQMVVDNFNQVNRAINAEIYPKNLDRCGDYFGSRCPMYALCHEGSMEGLHIEKKEIQENILEVEEIV